MQQYLSTIIYICVFGIILELILPENKLKKYIGVLVSLIMILTFISPIIDVLQSEDVVSTISSTLEEIQSKVEVKEYDISGLQNKIVFSSTKESIEKDIYNSCKEKFSGKYEFDKVKISLNAKYTIEDIDIYVKGLQEVALAGEIIDYVANTYSLDATLINIIKEEG